MQKELEQNRVIGTDFDEVLFADDTIIFSENHQTLQKIPRGIENVGENMA